jgi:hypothetical protein
MALFMNKARLPKFEPQCWQNSISKPLTKMTRNGPMKGRKGWQSGRSVKMRQRASDPAEEAPWGGGMGHGRFAAAGTDHIRDSTHTIGGNNFEPARNILDIR